MSREIKFRSAHYFHETNEFSHFSYWGLINHKGEIDNTCFSSPSQSNDTYRKVEEQITGLVDMNGNNIWEGDIFIPRYNYFRAMEVHFICGQFNVGEYAVANCEVLGNIHEDKHLLK